MRRRKRRWSGDGWSGDEWSPEAAVGRRRGARRCMYCRRRECVGVLEREAFASGVCFRGEERIGLTRTA